MIWGRAECARASVHPTPQHIILLWGKGLGGADWGSCGQKWSGAETGAWVGVNGAPGLIMRCLELRQVIQGCWGSPTSVCTPGAGTGGIFPPIFVWGGGGCCYRLHSTPCCQCPGSLMTPLASCILAVLPAQRLEAHGIAWFPGHRQQGEECSQQWQQTLPHKKHSPEGVREAHIPCAYLGGAGSGGNSPCTLGWATWSTSILQPASGSHSLPTPWGPHYAPPIPLPSPAPLTILAFTCWAGCCSTQGQDRVSSHLTADSSCLSLLASEAHGQVAYIWDAKPPYPRPLSPMIFTNLSQRSSEDNIKETILSYDKR